MEKNMNYNDIPVEKFEFADKDDLTHDQKFDTKPESYFRGALRRFSKNKGAVVGGIVILCLLIFAIVGPFCTEYSVAYYDTIYSATRPKSKLFYKLGWDGTKQKETGFYSYLEDYALALETGKEVIKDGKVEISEDGNIYTYKFDTYYGVGFGRYKVVTTEEYNDIQRYQDETGRQVLYPIVAKSDRPKSQQDNDKANIYYKTEVKGGKPRPVLDDDGNIIPVYWSYAKDASLDGTSIAPYTSKMRIEGEDGVSVGGTQSYYVYGRIVSGGVEVRAEYYEYYIYYHTQVAKDGITEPYFLFGTTSAGKDILTCLSSGARFSFLFAIVVAAVNLVIGAIWGSIAGYFGGRIDLLMERFSDILGAVPTMIVITLLKLHMGTSSQALVLFIAFFMTGWIGMASTTRMQFYRFKNQEYVLVARTLGAKDWRIMFKHIFPNAIGTLVTSCALVIPSMIYSETNLSYLGIINLESGNITSVGTMIAAGQRDMVLAPFVAIFPSIFLALMMLSFNLFGNGLRDAFNPSLRGSED